LTIAAAWPRGRLPSLSRLRRPLQSNVMTHLAPSSRPVVPGTPGRALRPVLALDMGGTRLRTALVLPTGEIAARRTARTPRGDAQALVGACLALLEDTRAEAARVRPVDVPVALAISAPGPLDPLNGVLVDPPNLDRSLWGFPLAGTLGAALGLPAVLERDTQVAALAEGRFGAGRGLADYVYLTVSTGIGGAVVSDGVLLRGPDGVAGELGHLVVDIDGPLCGCGARGHLEAIASGTGIAAAAREAIESGADPAFSPDSPLGRLARDAQGPLEASHVARAEEEGDPLAARIMERARNAFAAAVVSIVDIFNPSRVIVGGGLATGQGDRLLGPARELVRQQAFRIQAKRAEIVLAELGDDVGLAGGILLVGLAGGNLLVDSGATGSGQMGLHTDASSNDDLTDGLAAEIDQRQTAAAG
jgi:glucokinase